MEIAHENDSGLSTKITLDAKDIDNEYGGGGGLEISVKGFKANNQDDEQVQVFIERYDGKTQIHVWNNTNDPVTFVLEKEDDNPEKENA